MTVVVLLLWPGISFSGVRVCVQGWAVMFQCLGMASICVPDWGVWFVAWG